MSSEFEEYMSKAKAAITECFTFAELDRALDIEKFEVSLWRSEEAKLFPLAEVN